MSTFNNAVIVGRLGQDPEVRYSSAGVAFATLSVATSESWKDKQTGEKKERTDWIRVKASGRLAEIVGEYLKKGALVLFSGSIRVDEFNDKDGNKRYDTHIRADQMRMLGSKDESQRGGTGAPRQQDRPSRMDQQMPTTDDFGDDDIPFISRNGIH